ncbi:acyltransferase [Marilutibacter penaei]
MSAALPTRGSDWKQRPEGGSRFAIWVIQMIARHLGRGVARACLYPITAYFVLTRGPERRASRAYLSRALRRPAGLRDVARHIHTFAATILDRVYLLGGRWEDFDIRAQGLDAVHRYMDAGRGVLLFGSHLGSFDGLRALATQRPDVTVRVVLDKRHNPAVTQVIEALNPELARNIIDAGQDGPSIVLAIQQAAAEGALVAVLADRARPGEPTVDVPFMGRPAPFPTAPWMIAAVLGLPIALAFGLYRGGRRYDLVFEAFSDGLSGSRGDRRAAVDEAVRRYAGRLQHHAHDAPWNWFNFYDFWQDDTTDGTPDARD